MKVGLYGKDEQRVAEVNAELGDDVTLSLLQRMLKEGPKRNGAVMELRITQFNKLVKVHQRQFASKTASERFLVEQEQQEAVRDSQRGSGFQPNTQNLKAMLERMLIDSGEISSQQYESAMNFLGVPVEERLGPDDDDIPF